MSRLQTVSRPDIFQAIVGYDGSKNLFSSVQLPFNDGVSTVSGTYASVIWSSTDRFVHSSSM